MNAGTSVFAGVAVVISGIGTFAACTGPVQGGSTEFTEATPISTAAPSTALAGAAATAPTAAITASTPHPGPGDEAAATPPAATAAATPPPAAAPAVASATPVAPTTPTATGTAAAPTTATPTTAAPSTTAPAMPADMPKGTGFNAGSGTALPDGKTVEYHIPDGTGGTDWNKKDNPVRVRKGMVLHLVDDDKSTRAGGHWLHTNGAPCPHGLKAIGTGFDCNISMTAPTGLIGGVFEHNVANGIGQLYIEVVADAN